MSQFETEERAIVNALKDIFAVAKQTDPQTVELLSRINSAICPGGELDVALILQRAVYQSI